MEGTPAKEKDGLLAKKRGERRSVQYRYMGGYLPDGGDMMRGFNG